MSDPGEPGRRLVLVRHGQTDWNAEQRGQGHSDVDLNEVGVTQAKAAAPVLAALGPQRLWSSDLRRAAHTAQIIGGACGLEPRLDARLREYDLGERTGITMPEYRERYPEEYARFRAGQYDVVPGGETTPIVVARISAALGDALASVDPGETAMVVGHGAGLKVTLLNLLDLPTESVGRWRALDNCGWVMLEETQLGGVLRLVAYNMRATDAAFGPGPTF